MTKQKRLSDLKIHDSKGKLYYICPFLEKIQTIINESYFNEKPLATEELFEINRHMESIKEIARHLRGEDVTCGKLNVERIYEPYNFSAAIKTMKSLLKAGTLTEQKIEEITKQYF